MYFQYLNILGSGSYTTWNKVKAKSQILLPSPPVAITLQALCRNESDLSECSYLISDFVDSSAIEWHSMIVKKTDHFHEGGAQHGREEGLRHVQRRFGERGFLLICWFLVSWKSRKFWAFEFSSPRKVPTFLVVLRRFFIKTGLVCSPDKDRHGGDVKVFSLFPPLFGLCVDDTLDSLCLLLLATFGSWQEHLKETRLWVREANSARERLSSLKSDFLLTPLVDDLLTDKSGPLCMFFIL